MRCLIRFLRKEEIVQGQGNPPIPVPLIIDIPPSVPEGVGLAAISFTASAAAVWLGVAIWGLVNGVLDSVVKAVVTQLVGPHSRAAAFGWLALARGLGLLAAGAAIGVAYQHSPGTAVAVVVVVNVVGLVALAPVLRALPDRVPSRP